MSNGLNIEELECYPCCTNCGYCYDTHEEADKLVYSRTTASEDYYYCARCKEEGVSIGMIKWDLDDYTPPPQNPDEEADCDFATWWDREGSGIVPSPNEDQEEFMKRVSAIAWQNGFYKGAKR